MSDNRENNQEPGQIEADRGLPSISKKNRVGSGSSGIVQKITLFGFGLVVILALIAVNGGFNTDEDKTAKQNESTSNTEVLNRLGPAPSFPKLPTLPEKQEPDEQDSSLIKTGQIVRPPAPRISGQNEKKEPTPQDRKRSDPLLAFGNPSRSEQQRSSVPLQGEYPQGARGGLGSKGDKEGGGLASKLKPTMVSGARAGMIPDRSFFITQGNFLDCALETAISSDVPGFTSCRLTRDVYSTDSKVLLLERGSKIVGQYEGGLRRGQSRIFVLWTRIETPNGVIVNLNSPGTDALGRSGHSGFLDTHFWKRFGGAILLSLIDDFGTYLAHKASSNGSGDNQFQFGETSGTAQDAASIALKNSINIPDTLIKNQGDHISIYVARDLDFRGVYDLKTIN